MLPVEAYRKIGAWFSTTLYVRMLKFIPEWARCPWIAHILFVNHDGGRTQTLAGLFAFRFSMTSLGEVVGLE